MTKTNNLKKEAKLPKVFKSKWVKALRSGKYKRGTGSLYNKYVDGYNVLGIACKVGEIATERLNKKYVIPNKFNRVPILIKGEQNKNLIVKTILDLENLGKTHKEIAKWIEKNL